MPQPRTPARAHRVRKRGTAVRRASASPVEIYTPEQVAQFLLSNSLDARDYARSREEVLAMGLDPERIEHIKPPGA